jgi:hypothetical protein
MLDLIRTKITGFNKYLEQSSPKEDEKLIERLELLQVLLAQSGKYLADAKLLRDEQVQQAIKGVVSDPDMVGLSNTLMNEYVKSSAKDLNYLVNSLDRINSAAVHQIDSVRSILSYRRSQMTL